MSGEGPTARFLLKANPGPVVVLSTAGKTGKMAADVATVTVSAVSKKYKTTEEDNEESSLVQHMDASEKKYDYAHLLLLNVILVRKGPASQWNWDELGLLSLLLHPAYIHLPSRQSNLPMALSGSDMNQLLLCILYTSCMHSPLLIESY
jgi:hypothetical protein